MTAHPWLLLALAIVAEVVGTVALKASDGLRHALPVLIVIAGYGVAFVLMAQTLRVMPVGIVYTVWSGVGTAGVVVAGLLLFGETLTAGQVVGIGLVIAGVALLNGVTVPGR